DGDGVEPTIAACAGAAIAAHAVAAAAAFNRVVLATVVASSVPLSQPTGLRTPVKFWSSAAGFPQKPAVESAADFRVDPNAAGACAPETTAWIFGGLKGCSRAPCSSRQNRFARPGPARTASRRAGFALRKSAGRARVYPRPSVCRF